MKPTPNTLILSLSLIAPLIAQAADWTQYRGNGSGISAEPVAWKPAGLREVWKQASPGGFSSFTVAEGRAFTHELKEVEGASQEALVARDVATGKELWSQVFRPANYGHDGGNAGTPDNKGGDGPRSTPVVVGKMVVSLSAQLVLSAYDAVTGKPVWSNDLIANHAARNIQWQNAASPLFAGGLLYVAGGGPGQSILAINPMTGKPVWKAFDEMMTHATPVAANILGQGQIIFFLQSGLLAVEPKTGKELWRYKFPYKVSTAASPVVSGDIVYCSAGYGVGAGAVKISKQANAFVATEIYRVPGDKELANHWSTPVVKDGHMYGMFQFKNYGTGPVKCVEIATGKIKWAKEGFGPGHVVLVGNDVVALSDAGELVRMAADSNEYKELGRQKVLGGKCWTTPAVAGGRVFVRSTTEAACLE